MSKTGFLKAKIQVLETIFAELPPSAKKKVVLTIKFDDHQKLNTFKRLQAERKQEQEEAASLESDPESQNDEASLQLHKNLPLKKQPTGKLKYQKIDLTLQQGIIFKQFYEKHFQKIAETYKVKIKIRAERIAFEGYEYDDIEDAIDEVKQLMNHIEIEYIPKFGAEINESQMIKRKLEKVGVKIFRILDKYYRWYEIGPQLENQAKKKKRENITRTLSQIDQSNHCLQYLYSIEQDIDMWKGSRISQLLKLKQKFMNYLPLLGQLKGKIFEKEFKTKINAQAKEDEIFAELSTSRDAIVFHSIAKEYLQMTIKEVRVQFQVYDYFYLTIDSQHSIESAIQILKMFEYDTVMQNARGKSVIGQIEEVKEINYIHFVTNYQKVKKSIEAKMNDSQFYGDYIPKQSVIFCFGFRRKSPQKRLQFLCQMLQKLHEVWMGASYKISIILDQNVDIETTNVSYEFNHNEKIFSFSANQTSLETNLQILREYVIRKKLQTKKIEQFNQQSQDNNVTITTINASQYIHDQTSLNEAQTQDLNGSLVLNQTKKQSQKNIQEELKQNQKAVTALRCYKVFLPETAKQYNQKYQNSEVKEFQIVKDKKRNRSLESQIVKITSDSNDYDIHVYKISLNPIHRLVQFYKDPQKDQIVTVYVPGGRNPFVKPKELGLKMEEGLNETFPVRLLLLNQRLTQNGYLINIKKKNIELHDQNYRVKYGAEFQVAKEIVYLKK